VKDGTMRLIIVLPLVSTFIVFFSPAARATEQDPIRNADSRAITAGMEPTTPVADQSAPPAPTEPTVISMQPPVLGRLERLAGSLAVDTNGDGTFSATDEPAVTMVELVSMTRGVFSLFTNAQGNFEFKNVPDGDYDLYVWWGPGFVNLPPEPTNPALAVVRVSIDSNGRLVGTVPDKVLLLPNSTGAIPYPVRAGGSENIPVGTLNLIDAGTDAIGELPSTGVGPMAGNENLLVAGAVLLLAVVPLGLYVTRRRPPA
jgi:hypothetical protein